MGRWGRGGDLNKWGIVGSEKGKMWSRRDGGLGKEM